MKTKSVAVALLACLFLGISHDPAFSALTLTTEPAANNHVISLDGEGTSSQRIVKVASLTLSTDNSSGLTLTITSGNLAKVGSTDIYLQVVTVLANSSPPASGDFVTPSGSDYSYSTNSAGAEARDVYIKYQAQALQDPGFYAATINLSVTDR